MITSSLCDFVLIKGETLSLNWYDLPTKVKSYFLVTVLSESYFVLDLRLKFPLQCIFKSSGIYFSHNSTV